MDQENKIRLLKKVGFFKFLPNSTLELIAKKGKEITIWPNQVLFDEGSPGQSMYCILSGKLAVYKNRQTIAIRKPGEFVGEMALIDSNWRSASVKGVEKSILFEISEEQFQSHLVSNSKVLWSIMKTLSQRTRQDLDALNKGYRNLKKQEQAFSQILEILKTTSDQILIFEANSLRILETSKLAAKALCYSTEAIKSKTLMDLFDGLTKDSFGKIVEPLRLGIQTTVILELKKRRTDDSFSNFKFRVLPLEASKISIYIAIALEEEQLNYHSILEALTDFPSGIGFINKEMQIIFCNKTFERFLDKKVGTSLSNDLVALFKKKSQGNDKRSSSAVEASSVEIPDYHSGPDIFHLHFTALSGDKDKEEGWLLRVDFNKTTVPVKLESRLKDAGLTQREKEIAVLIKEGFNNKVIAERLFISPQTVISHKKSIYKKLGVHSQSQLIISLSQS